ncbi:multiple epidermal growth factor-like domains protein 11 [Crassostrea angulata]|uniref:multiple epidermal growth factor-like domains protein 11 n=1 Tax=Magallana angulata TaxID=2784310 RepID=UPI0022B0F0A6|nr:multiple epidermal growth factor-like domains protein 11 [Crassostrea angulata]
MEFSVFLILHIFLKVSADDCHRINRTCCYNEHVDNNTNECVACMNGSFGWNCESPCVTGYYGFLCKTPCECLHHFCDKETGCQSKHNETSATNYTLTTLSTINFENTVSQEKNTA